ncbi:Metallo-dependent phosphatase [Lophiostoma macrostomum CBS 122681]|uniref:Metallo-dependent phosphatase n=1 Tax=Lophiostoma macrostomum CBS 122681 TaxID=1314788 RepID=A0A6A6T374_9PLEO|nr:Metallo-dependent phosphatase [Lophiostoma macrostomum CBS 122681]
MAIPSKRPRSESRSPSPSSKKQKPVPTTRFLILSDTHSHKLATYPAADVLLHCGDLTDDGSPSSIRSALLELSKAPCPLKLVIAGNHEISLDATYWASEGGAESQHAEARSLVFGANSLAAELGITFLSEGTHTFSLEHGAEFKVYASPFTPRHGSSAFQYQSKEDRFNASENTPAWSENVSTEPSRIPDGVDIVMTHGPPQYILDGTGDGRSAGCEHLRRAVARVKPRLHCFGHIHGGYGAQRIEFTGAEGEEDGMKPLEKEWVGKNQAKRKGFSCLSPESLERWSRGGQMLCVNVTIMDAEGEATNMPWVVDMELPARG